MDAIINKLREWVLKAIMGSILMKKLEGYKTVIGMIGLVVCWLAPAFNVQVPDQASKLFEALIGVGLLHKYERGKEDVVNLKVLLESAMKDLEDLKKPK